MSDVIIRPPTSDDELVAGAQIMAGTEPWITLGRRLEHTLAGVKNPAAEKLVAAIDGRVVGILVMGLSIPLVKGYIISLAVEKAFRNRGIGRRLVAAAEERIFAVSPNAFLCVSSFNPDARRLYERLGYKLVGELTDFIIAGKHELLFRKTIGPWSTFKPADAKPA